MGKLLLRFRKAILILAAATVTFLCAPRAVHAQSSQDQQSVQTQDHASVPTPPVQADDITRRDLASFDRFLDDHREIAQQVRKDPSLLDNRNFVRDHPELADYLRDNPGVRDEIRQDPTAFMQREDDLNRDQRDQNAGDRDNGFNRDQRDMASFDRFLDSHREIAEQVRKDPSLLDDRRFVDNHTALQAYLADNPAVRDRIHQDPVAFVHQADRENFGDRDQANDRMAQFGGFLRTHEDIRRDVARDPSCVKDHNYVENHPELVAYLNDHPDVRAELMANPENFVHGAQQYGQPGSSGVTGGTGVTSGTGVSGSTGVTGHGATGTTGSGTGSMSGTSTTGTSTTGTSTTGATTNPPATTHQSKPNQ